MESEFKRLKNGIAEIVDSQKIECIKLCFEKVIESKRTFNRIKTIEHLFKVLEDRDELSEDNISSLIYIGEILKSEKINDLIRPYKKLQDPSDKCAVCHNEYLPLPVVDNLQQEIKNEFDSTTLEIVSENIGPKWRILIRELDVLNEKQIYDIRRKFKDNSKLQALEALKLWRQIEGQNATIAKLENALNHRLCKNEGLGSHVMNKIIKIQC